jgi:maleamate amidohydrolase
VRRWEEVFTGNDRLLVKSAGMTKKQPWGKKPALLIIDVTLEFIGSKSLPVLESVKEYRTSCGENGWKALPSIQKLLNLCRKRGFPVIYTVADYSARRSSHGAVKIEPPKAQFDHLANEIAGLIKPLDSELVIPKTRASGFFGTPLDSCLRSEGVDCLLVTGCTTSGCVRATVVDGFSLGYRCFVVEECVFDRFELSHMVNLFDLNAKYADVITLEEAVNYTGVIK